MQQQRITVPIESFDVRSADGLSIRAHRSGEGPHCWLIPPGLATPLLCWKHILERFHERMTIATWDQRGTYGSSSVDSGRIDLSFERHVEDGLAVVDALGWSGCATGSWSMGVQLGLAIYERIPERISALVLINGAFENVLSTAYGPPSTARFVRTMLRGLVLASPLLTPLAGPLVRRGWAGRVMDAANISTANREFVTAVTREVGQVDVATYFQIALELDRCSLRHVLSSVAVPTLITAGGKDKATPPRVARELHSLVRGSQYVEVPEGTHYLPLEYPTRLNAALERFFRTQAFSATWAAS